MHYLKNICLELISMIWDIYWGLAFGFMLSSVIRAFVPASAVSSRLGDNTVKSLGMATFFGAISSSCSYAAVSMARTLLVKGATWPNAVAFMVASTNLVFEIFIVIVSVLGWSFFGGEIIGGVLFIIISAWLIARFYPTRIAQDAKDHLDRQNKQHGDEDMHMAGHEQSGLQQKDVKEPETPKGFGDKLQLASGHFYMDVMMVGKDILVGVVAASVIMAVVPAGF
ncbi:MAG: metal ion permease, partial [Sphingobacteriaceae bacterium]